MDQWEIPERICIRCHEPQIILPQSGREKLFQGTDEAVTRLALQQGAFYSDDQGNARVKISPPALPEGETDGGQVPDALYQRGGTCGIA
jgi:hypothetical protein